MASVAGGDVVNGLAVTANPDGSYTAVWAEAANPEGIAPPGRVLSSDRAGGRRGGRGPPRGLVADLPDDIPGCGELRRRRPPARAATQLALWQQGGA